VKPAYRRVPQDEQKTAPGLFAVEPQPPRVATIVRAAPQDEQNLPPSTLLPQDEQFSFARVARSRSPVQLVSLALSQICWRWASAWARDSYHRILPPRRRRDQNCPRGGAPGAFSHYMPQFGADQSCPERSATWTWSLWSG
jgi:hypothetical protein